MTTNSYDEMINYMKKIIYGTADMIVALITARILASLDFMSAVH